MIEEVIRIDMGELKLLYQDNKYSLDKCGELLGCSAATIRLRLIKYGINIRKSGEWAKGRKLNKSQINRLVQLHIGKPLSEEHKKKISDSSQGRIFSEEHRKKIGDAHRGRKHPWSNQNGANNPNWNGGYSESWFEDPIVGKCYNIVRVARRRGDIIKQPCEVCGDTKGNAHHDDYRKPLELRWLCRSHHTLFHRSHIMKDYKYILVKEMV